MTLVIIGIILYIFISIIKTYGLDLKSIHHFSLVAHHFPTLSLYPHGDIEPLVFNIPYDNISDISEYFQSHIIYGKVIHHIGINICDPHHNFTVYKRN